MSYEELARNDQDQLHQAHVALGWMQEALAMSLRKRGIKPEKAQRMAQEELERAEACGADSVRKMHDRRAQVP